MEPHCLRKGNLRVGDRWFRDDHSDSCKEAPEGAHGRPEARIHPVTQEPHGGPQSASQGLLVVQRDSIPKSLCATLEVARAVRVGFLGEERLPPKFGGHEPGGVSLRRPDRRSVALVPDVLHDPTLHRENARNGPKKAYCRRNTVVNNTSIVIDVLGPLLRTYGPPPADYRLPAWSSTATGSHLPQAVRC